MGRGNTKAPLCPFSASFAKRRAPGVGQPQEFRGLVEGLADGIVQGFPQYAVHAQCRDVHELGMAPRYQQCQEGEGGSVGLEQRREQVPLQVMYTHRRLAPGGAQGGGKARPDQQGADEPWTRGIGYAVDRVPVGPSIGQNLPNQGQKPPNMVPGGQFRHYAPVGLVHCDLAVQTMRKQAQIGVIDGHGRLVTGAFDAQYPHISPGATRRIQRGRNDPD